MQEPKDDQILTVYFYVHLNLLIYIERLTNGMRVVKYHERHNSSRPEEKCQNHFNNQIEAVSAQLSNVTLYTPHTCGYTQYTLTQKVNCWVSCQKLSLDNTNKKHFISNMLFLFNLESKGFEQTLDNKEPTK